MVLFYPRLQHVRLMALCGWLFLFCPGGGVANALTSHAELGSGIEYRRLEWRLGALQGELCNVGRQPIDEFAVLFVAEDFRRRTLWHTVVDVAGLGSGRCRDFRRDPDDFNQPFRVRGSLVVFDRQPLLPAGNLNLPLQLRGAAVRNRQLSARFCNRSGSQLRDASVNLLGLSGHGEVLWRENFPVTHLDDADCLDLQKVLDTGRLARKILYNVLPVGPPFPLQEGELEPGLDYARLRVRVGHLRGEICNRQQSEVRGALVKVYALRENGAEAWSQSLYLPALLPGACRVFSEKIIGQSIRPSAWRFRVVGLTGSE